MRSLQTTVRSIVFVAAAAFGTLNASATTPSFTTFQPGQKREINQDLPINIVFVGYQPGSGPRDINEAVFRAGLPHRYRALDIGPSLYIPSNVESDQIWNGNSFDYNYNIVYASQAFEDAYFNYVPTISFPCLVTVYQEYYNTQQSRSLDITDNSCVEANLAEKWLAENAPAMLGVDTSKNTVFLINWYGRSDFRFHTYLPFEHPDPDPDTGFNPSEVQQAEGIAWGGTTPDDPQSGLGSLRRVWFYDLSAGPDWRTTNYLLDAPEFGGSFLYTMPPVWEYGNTSAYRPFVDLSGDLSKVTRYVALDCLFTTSPVYSPALSPPKMPQSIQVDVNFFNGDPTANGRDFLKADRLISELSAIRPYNTFSASITDQSFSGRVAEAYQCARASMYGLNARSCYGGQPSFVDLFLYFRSHQLQYINGGADYEVPVFSFFVPDNQGWRFTGLADDNHSDGTQSFIYTDSIPSRRQFFGETVDVLHETGHHLGAAHPHDGFDYEDFSLPSAQYGAYWFMWAGDLSDTIMSYQLESINFSQFDRDNMNRWMTAVYINQANAILPKILASPRAGQVNDLLNSGDADAASALVQYDQMDYLGAVLKAKSAYDKVLAAAAQINILIEPNGAPSELRNHRPNPGLIDPQSFIGRPALANGN
jgi:hypothetical protein